MDLTYKNYETILSGLDTLETLQSFDSGAKSFILKRLRELTQFPYYKRFSKILNSYPTMKEFILEATNLPSLLKVRFFPKTGKIEFKEKNDFTDILKLDLSSIKDDVIKNYDQINLNFVRKRGALFEYEIQVHASILDVFSEKAGAIAVGIAATIAVTNSAKIEKHFDYLENRLELQKKYSFVLKSGANSDFISTAISAASELSSSEEELKLKEKIILFTNQYFD